MADGDLGTVAFNDGVDTITLPTEGLRVNYAGGKSAQIYNIGSTSPRSADYTSGNQTYQIHAELLGATAYDDASSIREMFEQIFKQGALTMTLTNIWSDMYGSSHRVIPDGSSGLQISAVPGSRNLVLIDIQVRVVKNTDDVR